MITDILVGIDQLINTLVYIRGDGFGKPDETLSARAFRLQSQSDMPRRVIDTLFFWQKAHCESAYNAEVLRKQLPDAYSNSV